MMKMTRKILWSLTAVFVLLCGGCTKQAVLYDSEQSEEELRQTAEEEAEIGTDEEEVPVKICVYVCGEVVSPGVYELDVKARVGEAVDAAGGMTEDAAKSWLNLAEHMTDGQKIEVPSREQAEMLKEESEEQGNGLVNLNTATAEQLITLPGIGESKAADILNYREQHGSFQTTEELMQISGIKERVFEKIKDQITV